MRSSSRKTVRSPRARRCTPMSTPATNQRLLTYVDALREAVAQEMKHDPRVFVFGLDVDDHKAIQGSTRGLVDDFGPDRVFGTPLSEDAMTGIAIGAAMAGMRPIHVHIRMDFLMLGMNQLVNIAAKSRYMYGGAVSVPLVVRCIIGKSWGQGAQHSQGLHAMFMHVPGFKVVAQVIERAGPSAGIAVRRLGFAATTCPTSPPLEHLFYPNPTTIAAAAHALIRPDAHPWRPDPERVEATAGLAFRGPF